MPSTIILVHGNIKVGVGQRVARLVVNEGPNDIVSAKRGGEQVGGADRGAGCVGVVGFDAFGSSSIVVPLVIEAGIVQLCVSTRGILIGELQPVVGPGGQPHTAINGKRTVSRCVGVAGARLERGACISRIVYIHITADVVCRESKLVLYPQVNVARRRGQVDGNCSSIRQPVGLAKRG